MMFSSGYLEDILISIPLERFLFLRVNQSSQLEQLDERSALDERNCGDRHTLRK